MNADHCKALNEIHAVALTVPGVDMRKACAGECITEIAAFICTVRGNLALFGQPCALLSPGTTSRAM